MNTCRFSAFFTIRCCQTDADSALVNLKAQAALLVIVGLLAQFREFGGVGKHPHLKFRIVGVDLRSRVIGIVKNLRDFLFLGKSCSHGKSSFFRKYFSALEPGKRGRFPLGLPWMMSALFGLLPSDNLRFSRVLSYFHYVSTASAFLR